MHIFCVCPDGEKTIITKSQLWFVPAVRKWEFEMAKMSEDGFSDCFDEPNMEIQIKTLMGTTFDIKVAHTDTVGDIKKKIFRVEGTLLFFELFIYLIFYRFINYLLCTK